MSETKPEINEEANEAPQETPSSSSSNTEVQIVDWVAEGFQLYKANFGVLFISGLVLAALAIVSLGLLAGPLLAGYFLIAIALVDKQEPAPKVSDVFKGFENFLQPFLFVIAWALINMAVGSLLETIPTIGGILSFLVSIVLGAGLMFGIPLIADRKLDVIAASKQSVEKMLSAPGPFIGFFCLGMLAGMCGAILFGIGALLTYPIYACALAIAYRKSF